jgi:hypothetical protein
MHSSISANSISAIRPFTKIEKPSNYGILDSNQKLLSNLSPGDVYKKDKDFILVLDTPSAIEERIFIPAFSTRTEKFITILTPLELDAAVTVTNTVSTEEVCKLLKKWKKQNSIPKGKSKKLAPNKNLRIRRAQVVEVKWPKGFTTKEVVETVFPNDTVKLFQISSKKKEILVAQTNIVRIVKPAPFNKKHKKYIVVGFDALKLIYDHRDKKAIIPIDMLSSLSSEEANKVIRIENEEGYDIMIKNPTFTVAHNLALKDSKHRIRCVVDPRNKDIYIAKDTPNSFDSMLKSIGIPRNSSIWDNNKSVKFLHVIDVEDLKDKAAKKPDSTLFIELLIKSFNRTAASMSINSEIIKNPTSRQAYDLANRDWNSTLRLIIDRYNNVYIARASLNTFQSMCQSLGLECSSLKETDFKTVHKEQIFSKKMSRFFIEDRKSTIRNYGYSSTHTSISWTKADRVLVKTAKNTWFLGSIAKCGKETLYIDLDKGVKISLPVTTRSIRSINIKRIIKKSYTDDEVKTFMEKKVKNLTKSPITLTDDDSVFDILVGKRRKK